MVIHCPPEMKSGMTLPLLRPRFQPYENPFGRRSLRAQLLNQKLSGSFGYPSLAVYWKLMMECQMIFCLVYLKILPVGAGSALGQGYLQGIDAVALLAVRSRPIGWWPEKRSEDRGKAP